MSQYLIILLVSLKGLIKTTSNIIHLTFWTIIIRAHQSFGWLTVIVMLDWCVQIMPLRSRSYIVQVQYNFWSLGYYIITPRAVAKLFVRAPCGIRALRIPIIQSSPLFIISPPSPNICISLHSCDKITANKSMKNVAFFLLWTTVESEG